MQTTRFVPVVAAAAIVVALAAFSNDGGSSPVRHDDGDAITICSFNIQWLGYSDTRENAALADLLEGYDIVVVQELVSPPYPGSFPEVTPAGFVSVNNRFLPTNTQMDESYDHAMMSLYRTSEVDLAYGFVVVDLVQAMTRSWSQSHTDPYPGSPYDHDAFRAAYSDHNPVVLRLTVPGADDDG